MTKRTSGDRVPRVLEAALFVAAMLWAAGMNLAAGRTAASIAGRLQLSHGQELLESLVLLVVCLLGFRALDFFVTRMAPQARIFSLPRRRTAAREWGSGFATGWGLCLAAVLPLLLVGDFHAALNRGAGVAPGILVAIATLAVAALAEEVIFRGYPFQRLVNAIGPGWASLVMSALFVVVLVSGNAPRSLFWALLDTFLFGIVLAMCYLRTRGLWVGWGLHFGYRVVMAVVLGLPIAGRSDFGSLMDGRASGPLWLSGGGFGLDATAWTAVVLLAGLGVVYRATRDWAWAYTLPEIVAAGYAVEVAPPPAHAAMEKAVAPPPLVQILPVTSQSFSVRDESGPEA